MDVQKLNSVKLRAIFYLIPFVLMLAASMSYLLFIIRVFPFYARFPAILFQFLFLLSLSNVCANLTMEIYLTLIQGAGKSEINSILYKGSCFFPLRAALFVVIFIACFIVLTQTTNYTSAIANLIMLVPPFAIFINARYFISGRLRFIGGTYLVYTDSFKKIFSYFADENGFLCFITENGQTIKTEILTIGIDFEKLVAEFSHNNLNKPQ